MSRRYPDNRKYYYDDRGQPPRPSRPPRDQRDADNRHIDNRRDRDYPSSIYLSRESSSYGSSRNPQASPYYDRDYDRDYASNRDRDRREDYDYDRPRSEYGGSRSERRRSRSPPPIPNPRRHNQIINNHQPGGLRSGRLTPPRRTRDSGRNNSRSGRLSPLRREYDSNRDTSTRSGRHSPAPSITSSSGSRTPAHVPARTTEISRAPSRVPSRAPSPVRTRPPVDLRTGILSPPPKEKDSERSNARSGRVSPTAAPKPSTTSGSKTLAAAPASARTAQPSKAAPSRVPSRSRSPVRARSPIRARQPDDLKSGKLSAPPREGLSQNNNSRSEKTLPAPSKTSGIRVPGPARIAQLTKALSRAPTRAPSPVRAPPPARAPAQVRTPAPESRPAPTPASTPASHPAPAPAPRPAQAPRPAPTSRSAQAPRPAPAPAPRPAQAPSPAAPAQATKTKGSPAPTKTKNTRNTFHFLELSLVENALIHDSHILLELGNCMDECERENPSTPWEEQEKGKKFLKWFNEYRRSVATLRPTVPDVKFGNQVMRDHAMLAMKDMIKKGLTRRKLFTELYPLPLKGDDNDKKDDETKANNQDPEPKPTIDVQTDVICLLRPPLSKRSSYITFAPYHLSPSLSSPSPSNVLLTTSPALTNLAGSYPFTLSLALPVLSDLKRIAFPWDSSPASNGPGLLPADLAFLYPGNLPALETIYILHPEIRPSSEWFWVSPDCDTFRGGEGMGSEALFVEVREVDVEMQGNGKGGMWEVLGEENGGKKKDVWGRGGEVSVSEGVRDALREVKALETMYTSGEGNKDGKGKGRKVIVKLMGCIPVKN